MYSWVADFKSVPHTLSTTRTWLHVSWQGDASFVIPCCLICQKENNWLGLLRRYQSFPLAVFFISQGNTCSFHEGNTKRQLNKPNKCYRFFDGGPVLSFLAALPMLPSCLAGVVRNFFDLDLKLTEGKVKELGNSYIAKPGGEESCLHFLSFWCKKCQGYWKCSNKFLHNLMRYHGMLLCIWILGYCWFWPRVCWKKRILKGQWAVLVDNWQRLG